MQAASTTVSVPFVDLKAQYASIKGEIDAAIANVIAQTAFVGGPFVKEFEQAFASYCGVGHCVGVANGTDAIAIALRALGVGPGDEVITAANSFIATSEAIRMAGAQVVFVDIDPRTYNIDVGADRGEDHTEDQGHHSGAPLRPTGGHGPDHGPREEARPEGRRRRGAGARVSVQGPAGRDASGHHLLQLLPGEEPRRLRRRRRHRHGQPRMGADRRGCWPTTGASRSTNTISRA